MISGKVFITELLLQYPSPAALQSLMKYIDIISPAAAKSYNQAMEAKYRGLDELAGIGIRKSLDYLLYDFGALFFPEKKDFNDNPKTTLSDRIKEFIENSDIRNLAEACTWLGNDFTHPIRRHPEKEMNDLEVLAESLFYHMNMTFVARNAKAALEAQT